MTKNISFLKKKEEHLKKEGCAYLKNSFFTVWSLRDIARTRGGGSRSPYLFWLSSRFWPQNHVSQGWHRFQLILLFFRIFLPKTPKKKGENWKSFKKLLKMTDTSNFFNFWAISTCNTSKESIFHIEFNFTQKKYNLCKKDLKKSNFSDFFWQNQCWLHVFICRYLKACAVERFWH